MQLNFETAYLDYLKYVDVKQKNQSKRTVKDIFKSHILPYWGKKDIYLSNINDFIEWQQILKSKNYKQTYLKKIHYVMSGFLEYCIKFHGLNKNIAKQVGCIKSENCIISHNIYTPKQFKKFIKNVFDIVYKIFFKFLYLTGLRPGESMALKFVNLHFLEIDVIHNIEEHIDKETGKRKITTPKTPDSKRTVGIDFFLYLSLLFLKRCYKKKYGYFDENFFIFGGKEPLAPTSIRRKIHEASKLANLHYIKPHEFRHSHASYLNHKRVDINIIASRLGHANPSTTLNTYVHLYKNTEKRVIKTLSLMRLFHNF